jgi:hypothetical protein
LELGAFIAVTLGLLSASPLLITPPDVGHELDLFMIDIIWCTNLAMVENYRLRLVCAGLSPLLRRDVSHTDASGGGGRGVSGRRLESVRSARANWRVPDLAAYRRLHLLSKSPAKGVSFHHSLHLCHRYLYRKFGRLDSNISFEGQPRTRFTTYRDSGEARNPRH